MGKKNLILLKQIQTEKGFPEIFVEKQTKRKTYAIFSERERQGTSSSISSSLSSPSSPSSLPDILNEEEVNISGTGKIEGLRLPVNEEKKKVKKTRLKRKVLKFKKKQNLEILPLL